MHLAPLGESAVLIELAGPEEAAHAAALLRQALPAAREVVSGLDSVLVIDPRDDLADVVVSALGRTTVSHFPTHHLIEVVLDGPDLAEVAEVTGMNRAEVASALGVPLRVATVGFSPGFGYLTGLTGPLADLPRRRTPRPQVPAGSLAVAAGMAAIYPQATPGGWWLLGRSSATLFDPAAAAPSALSTGDVVRLHVVTTLTSAPPSVPRVALAPPDDVRPVLEVRGRPSGTTVVDGGRCGVAHLGVPSGGAMDPERAAVAAALVGGAPGAIEVTGIGLELEVLASTIVAGVEVGVRVDGRAVPEGVPVAVAAGQRVQTTSVGRGARGYLGVAGGPRVTEVLGSMSTDSLAGVGPGLEVGDVLGGGSVPSVLPVHGAVPRDPRPAIVRYLPGPHRHLLHDTLDGRTAAVSPTSNRVGLRLVPEAGPLARASGEIRSVPTVLGAIQLPPDGCPIVLGPDRATLGGYPLVGVVISADHGLLGRLGPGDLVTLVEVDEIAARAAPRERERGRTTFVDGIAPTLT